MSDDLYGPSFKPRDKHDNGINGEAEAVQFAKGVELRKSHLKFTPQAADESNDPDKFWCRDEVDSILPSHKGFITDVIYHYRGHEVSKLFMYWASLIAIAGVVKREAYLANGNGRLFTNLYLLIVGDSGSAKNTVTDFVKSMLDYFEHAVMEATSDEYIPEMKRVDAVTSGATRAGLQEAMKPANKRGKKTITMRDAYGNPIIKKNGQPAEYFQTSEITIVQEEMSVFLNRQQFLDDLLPWLINMYDPKDREEVLTRNGGREEFRNILVNMVGNTTPVALKDTLPAGVQSDGFLSRCLLIYQSYTDHMFPDIRIPDMAPTQDDLKRNLGWIAATTFVQYDLTPEAKEWFNKWYEVKWNEVRASGVLAGLKSRHKVMIKKIAALIRWQRYERNDRLIHLEDMIDASKLIELTVSLSTPLYMMLLDPKASEKTLKIEETLRKMGMASRVELAMTTHTLSEDMTYAMKRLFAEGLVEVEAFLNGKWNKSKGGPTHNPKERYIWKGRQRSKYADLPKLADKRRKPIPLEEDTKNGHHPTASEETYLVTGKADR